MRIKSIIVWSSYALLSLAMLAGTASLASAQNVNIAPDDRYKGYPTSLVKWADALPNLSACVAGEGYEPTDTHLMQYTSRVKIAGTRVSATNECRWENTSKGWRWVLRPKGTKYALDALGRELFDMGSPNGKPCGNATPYGIPVNVPPAEAQVIVPPPPAPIAEPPAPAPVVVPPPPAAVVVPPPAPRPIPAMTHLEPVRKSRLIITFGVDYVAGVANSNYDEAIPNSGDVPQRHNFGMVRPRIDLSQPVNGIYASFASSLLGQASNMEYQAIDGWNTKRRDSDNSVDKSTELKVGYRRVVGEYFTVAGFAGWQQFGIHEKYFAQLTDTTTNRDYKGVVFGGQLTGATDSLDHQVSVNVSAGFGPIKRTLWTQQVYQGKAFPLATNPDANGHSLNIRLEGAVQVWKGLHANVAYNHLHVNSSRTNTFVADERFDVDAWSIGISYKLAIK